MRFVLLIVLAGLAACSEGISGDAGPGPIGYFAHHQQVQRDVSAMMQGMNQARQQSEAIARARAQ